MIPPTSLRQPATYANPAIRGQLRHWKEKLARQYRVLERAFGNGVLRPLVEDMTKRGSPQGRRRAFEKIVRALGPGVILEGLRLDGDYPLALWSVLKPRESVTVDAPVESGLMQDCVTVNYVLAGRLPRVLFGTSEGIWDLEVPDHALGRAIERSGLLPDVLIAEAHHNLLRLRADIVFPNGRLDKKTRFLVKAGAGGFVCQLRAGEDVSLGNAMRFRVRSDTWLAEDMLRDEQILLADDGAPGQRLSDSWLLAGPLLRIVREGDWWKAAMWGPGLPELLAKPIGRA
jgi:hypothetical protein